MSTTKKAVAPGRATTAETASGFSVTPPATAGNTPFPRGFALARGQRLAIAALAVRVFQPSVREWRIIQASVAKLDPSRAADQLELLLLEAGAPSRECEDFTRMIALSSPRGVGAVVRARLNGYLPPDTIEEIAAVAGPLAFGASVRVKPLQAGKGGSDAG